MLRLDDDFCNAYAYMYTIENRTQVFSVRRIPWIITFKLKFTKYAFELFFSFSRLAQFGILSTKCISVIISWEREREKRIDCTTRCNIKLHIYSLYSTIFEAFVCLHFCLFILMCVYISFVIQKVKHAHRISLDLVRSGRKIQLPYTTPIFQYYISNIQ